jgi:subtilisin family serine protease
MPEEKYTMDHRISASSLAAKSRRRGKHSPGNLIDQLECRRLLSAALTNITWRGQSVQAIADSYVVEVKSGTDFSALAAKKGFTDIQSLGGDGFYSFDSTLAPSVIAAWGTGSASVIDVEPNIPVQAASVPTPSTPAVIPNDTYFQNGDQYNLYNYGQTITNAYGVALPGVAGDDIDATQAWTISTGSKNVVVADLDTGIDLTHPDLENNIWTNEAEANGTPGLDNDGDGYIDDIHGWNFIANDNDVNDDNGHGTMTAGIIGAEGNNGIGIAGINWNVTIVPVKVLDANGEGTTATIIQGIEYITTLKNLWVSSGGKDGANITAANVSLGSNNFPYDSIEARAYQQAGNAGILIIAAAGNGTDDDGTPIDLDNSSEFPGKYSLNLSNVITVASVDNQGNLSLFSNYGAESVQVAAPGESITSTIPPDLDTTDGNDDGYTTESGTSFAAPEVTGIIALMASIEPNATAAQLKQALFSSVDPLPSLEPLTSTTTGKVTTGGEVNAYKALLAIQNLFVQSDTYTKGNWQGYGAGDIYGTSGAYIAGESTSFPTGVTITGGSTEVLGDSTNQVNKNISALQTIGDPSQRIEAGLTSATSIDVDLNLTTPEQVTLYLADYDKQKRTESVQVIDPATGASISGQYSQTVSNFSGGEYLTYQLSGNVELQITKVAGPNAILNAVFLDPVPATAAPGAAAYGTFVSTNTTAAGNFQSAFGSQGVYLPGQSSNFPSFVNVNVTGGTIVSGGSKSSQLDNVAGTGTVKTYLSSASQILLDMNFTDGLAHQTTFYAADAKNGGLAERIEIVDPTTGNVLASQDLSNFKNGAYATFDLSGHVQVRIIRLAGSAAVLGGVFFDAPAGQAVSYVGVDSTTRGNWMGAYGNAGDYIVGESTSPVSLGIDYNNATATVTVLGATPSVVSTTSKSQSALELSSGTHATRIISRLVARSTFSVNVDFSDSATHQLAIYLADTDTNNERSETIQVTHGTSTAQQQVSDFKNGKYIVFSVRGNVTITVTNVRGPNAILNGLFFD